ncbi:Hypothetical predicted protein [Mytilus galloprovincialis]|uniref:Uncharacterized protein n=1 Tax=Mytilus galloprovincialis TaxID=29158 RepID=A0A8B6F9C5_MYTGA|nr:Hypothetical predicted protein [Mytilus galloprovincialis]
MAVDMVSKTSFVLMLFIAAGTSNTVTNDDDTDAVATILVDSEYTSVALLHSTKSNITTVTTNSQRPDISTNKNLTSKSEPIAMTSEYETYAMTSNYDTNATDVPFLYGNSVFVLQIGVAVSVSCLVILIAAVTCCVYKPKRGTYTFPISKCEENVVMAMEGPPQPTRSSNVLDGKYSDPIDKASTSNETSGPRFCATKVGQNTNFQKPENGCEYQHLDFTLRSETSPYFAENSEYDHTRVNMVSVFNQPWDTASSKVNKLFSHISKSVVQKGQNVRKSLIQMRSDSPQLKCRASDNCDVKETQLDHQQFVLDSIVDNQRDKNIDVAHSIVDDNKNDSEFKYAASKFAVLPFSERINVKSTHIYDQPNDKRLSLRERLKFGGPRKQSIIYSLATAIDDINESEA